MEHMAREIKVLTSMLSRCINRAPNKQKVDEITGMNAWIIGYIAQNSDRDVFQRDFEREFGMTRSGASKVVHLMEKKGLIQKKSVPQDARLKKLVLTDKSRNLARLMEEDFYYVENTLCRGFSEEEIHQTVQYIRRMQQNLQEEEKATK